MSSSDQFAEPLQMIDATAGIIPDPDVSPAPFEATTGEKRKREGKFRSRVWLHFTRLEKRPGEREECQCNHCGQFYACSSRCGTTHLNRHIFDGGCPKYKPPPSDSQTPTVHARENFEDILNGIHLRVDQTDSQINSNNKETLEQMEAQVARLKEDNAKLQQEKDALIAQKENLEQLLVTMASETARLTEENTKLKEDCAKLQEEKHKIVTREEFMRLEARVSKLKEDFEKDRRGFPAAAVAALAQIHKNR
ncbi:uncharacterized protein LOC116211165 isoform X2 [Punica granatum]|uniref:Uncharacterized protein LOC116211165 isoform X2 n=1 Tax=Punica granatum TaxID=22663 RepID=A0A218W810_PUNGR|nr:uncharacterized protein LOC116211165 isoform X2 [Punica granatum]OWM69017.1 hypothetical protein CDL15_Pgr025204 [Punica granatum]